MKKWLEKCWILSHSSRWTALESLYFACCHPELCVFSNFLLDGCRPRIGWRRCDGGEGSVVARLGGCFACTVRGTLSWNSVKAAWPWLCGCLAACVVSESCRITGGWAGGEPRRQEHIPSSTTYQTACCRKGIAHTHAKLH